MRNVTRIEMPTMENQEVILGLLSKSLDQFNAHPSVQINLKSNEIEIIGAPAPAIHQFTLQCEYLGNQLDYEKQTIIKIK